MQQSTSVLEFETGLVLQHIRARNLRGNPRLGLAACSERLLGYLLQVVDLFGLPEVVVYDVSALHDLSLIGILLELSNQRKQRQAGRGLQRMDLVFVKVVLDDDLLAPHFGLDFVVLLRSDFRVIWVFEKAFMLRALFLLQDDLVQLLDLVKALRRGLS